MTAGTEYLKLPKAMEYVDIKNYRTFYNFCKELNIPIVQGRVSKSIIDKKLSGKR